MRILLTFDRTLWLAIALAALCPLAGAAVAMGQAEDNAAAPAAAADAASPEPESKPEPENVAPATAPSEGDYDELPVESALRVNRSRAMALLNDGRFDSPESRKIFDDYYLKYEFPNWTLKANLAKVARLRTTLSSSLSNSTLNARPPFESHDHLNELVLDFMGNTLATGNFSPIVRFNAMYMVGDLNSVEPTRQTEGVPWPAAVPVLLKALNDPTQLDVVRVAALIGLDRHASKGGIQDAQVRGQVVDALVALIDSAVPSTRDAPVHYWMQARAAHALGYLSQGDAVAKPVDALMKLLNNPKAGLTVRSTAAEALGRANLQAATGFDATAAVQAIGQLALDDLDAERGDDASRVRLKSRLMAARAALSGAQGNGGVRAALANDAARATAQSIDNSLGKMIDAIDTLTQDTPNLPSKLGTAPETLKKALSPN